MINGQIGQPMATTIENKQPPAVRWVNADHQCSAARGGGFPQGLWKTLLKSAELQPQALAAP
jgi:hypothetical protein